MHAPLVFVSLCIASGEHVGSARTGWPWETTMPSLSTGDGKPSTLHATNMDHGTVSVPGPDEGDAPVILTTPKGKGLAGDPVNDFQTSVKQLKESITETETLMASALRVCKEHKIEDCDTSRQVLEVRGKMHRLMIAMKRLKELKPMAFEIRQLKRNSTSWVKNSTNKLDAARISLSSVMLTREALRAKLDSLQKVENEWKHSMGKISKIVVETQMSREDAQQRATAAENKRLVFLSKLEAILQGVDVGDRSAEIRYERAERKLAEAEDREAKAKQKIFEAEKLVDKAYHQQRKAAQADLGNVDIEKVMNPGPIVRKDEESEKEVDRFGRGSTADHPLPVVPHTLLAHSLRHRRLRRYHRHHKGQAKSKAFTPGIAKLQSESAKLQEQLQELEASPTEAEAEKVAPIPPDQL